MSDGKWTREDERLFREHVESLREQVPPADWILGHLFFDDFDLRLRRRGNRFEIALIIEPDLETMTDALDWLVYWQTVVDALQEHRRRARRKDDDT